MRLEAPRLRLRPLGVGDLGWVHPLNMAPDTRLYVFDDASWTPEETMSRLLAPNEALWAREGLGLFAVEVPGAASPAGWCGFWYFHVPPVREVGFAIDPTHRGHGYAAEAARAVMAFGAAIHGDTRFQASADVPNAASRRILASLGFAETHRAMGRVHEVAYYAREAAGLRVDDIVVHR